MRVRTVLSARSIASAFVAARNRLLRVVDLEREIHPALEIEPALQRNAAGRSRRAATPSAPRTRASRCAGTANQTDSSAEADDGQYAPLQGHTTAGRRKGSCADLCRRAFNVNWLLRLRQREPRVFRVLRRAAPPGRRRCRTASCREADERSSTDTRSPYQSPLDVEQVHLERPLELAERRTRRQGSSCRRTRRARVCARTAYTPSGGRSLRADGSCDVERRIAERRARAARPATTVPRNAYGRPSAALRALEIAVRDRRPDRCSTRSARRAASSVGGHDVDVEAAARAERRSAAASPWRARGRGRDRSR